MDILTIVNISGLDLNLLLVLHAVYENKSVVAAAQRLHVTPSAVSNALARLRAALSDPLFVRHGRGLTPTPRAIALAPVVARALGDLEQALDSGARFDPSSATRDFTIALADNDQIGSLPALAQAFARALPKARLHVISVDALLSAGGLAAPVADALIGPPLVEDGVHSAPLYEEEPVLLVRRDHPEVGPRQRALSREQFNRLRHVDTLVALGKPGAGHRAASDMFARHGLTRDVAVTVPSFAAAAMVAAHTDLVAALPRRVGDTFARSLALRRLALPVTGLRMPLHLLWHERTHDDAGARFFRSLILRVLGQRPKRGRG
jgi:DNA-binding transcriptional LysR family regulator